MSTRELKAAIRDTSEHTKTESVIDYVRDFEDIEIDVDCLKPLPEHDKYFFKRTGKDWIFFLNSVDKYGIYEPKKGDSFLYDLHECYVSATNWC